MIKKLLFAFFASACFTTLSAQGNGTVCGTIYNDANGNLSLDLGEEGVGGVNVIIIIAPTGQDISMPEITNSYGNFCFGGLIPGTYTFMVEVPEGWQVVNDNNTFEASVYDEMPVLAQGLGLKPVASVKQDTAGLFSLYPNPASTSFNLHFAQPANGEVTLYDVSGRQVLYRAFNAADVSVNTEQLPAGVYLVKATANGKAETTRLIITK